jgi:hypothetical protein
LKKRKVLHSVIVVILLLVLVMPVMAVTHYYDPPPWEQKGDWNPVDNEAMEFTEPEKYEVCILFTFMDVPTDYDNYKLEIDYWGVEPGYWPFTESLIVIYKWSGDEDWEWHLTLDINEYHAEKTIKDPSSPTLYVKFYDAAPDNCQNTWYFGSEPILHYYNE